MKMSNELLIAARKAMKNSNGSMGHKIGAAVLASSGKIYGGCSLTSIPQDYCAERVALLKAVSEGERKIESILITWEGPFGRLQGPCGICLNALWQLTNNLELEVLLWPTEEKEPVVKKLKDFYPYPYTPNV